MRVFTQATVSDVCQISRFLSCPQITSLKSCPPVDVLVLCMNAILPIVEEVFSAIESRPNLTKTLVLSGGIGHSTPYLYEAIRKSKYSSIFPKIIGLPEAQVIVHMIKDFYPRLSELFESNAVNLIVEDKSTNCGSNAIETRRVLELANVPSRSFIIVQDPTMSIRTVASFKHAYAESILPVLFSGCPTFIPILAIEESSQSVLFSVPGINSLDLWDVPRFLDLLMGEIPRLRDDKNGYGPNGKNFISHVDIPDQVEGAWSRLKDVLSTSR
ncbi:uncharacterized protein A1O9_01776 [Exophiala aquamarina CBS 119918]|uniref:Uncharacterized protein n=1 Tax=Exophiala aquamarina CBS 119918 TaxID=1182545 RepID=A0A072PWR9_9EURO|nr:uncharacterized protein A1O9_01776 [Exophiala aquamarina CBS 119918]KEF63798.1 hypothetical protein A1O9_01776 [Exophiala aquamarina CBS 119918]